MWFPETVYLFQSNYKISGFRNINLEPKFRKDSNKIIHGSRKDFNNKCVIAVFEILINVHKFPHVQPD